MYDHAYNHVSMFSPASCLGHVSIVAASDASHVQYWKSIIDEVLAGHVSVLHLRLLQSINAQQPVHFGCCMTLAKEAIYDVCCCTCKIAGRIVELGVRAFVSECIAEKFKQLPD